MCFNRDLLLLFYFNNVIRNKENKRITTGWGENCMPNTDVYQCQLECYATISGPHQALVPYKKSKSNY